MSPRRMVCQRSRFRFRRRVSGATQKESVFLLFLLSAIPSSIVQVPLPRRLSRRGHLSLIIRVPRSYYVRTKRSIRVMFEPSSLFNYRLAYGGDFFVPSHFSLDYYCVSSRPEDELMAKKTVGIVVIKTLKALLLVNALHQIPTVHRRKR